LNGTSGQERVADVSLQDEGVEAVLIPAAA